MDALIIKDVEVGWMNPRVLIVCGLYVLLFTAYLFLAFAAVKKKSWKRIVGSIVINIVLLLLILQVGFLWGTVACESKGPKKRDFSESDASSTYSGKIENKITKLNNSSGLNGYYEVCGYCRDKSKYLGEAEIVSVDDNIYLVNWEIDNKKDKKIEMYRGIGFLNDNRLCVYYENGAALYSIKNEELSGKWIMTKIEKAYQAKDITKTISLGTEILNKRKNTNFSPAVFSEELLRKAESGDAISQFLLAYSYLHGACVQKNEKEFVKWLIKSAEQGNPQAQSKLAALYLSGLFLDKNEKEGVKWLTESARQGVVKDEVTHGECLKEGIGVAQDTAKAFKCFEKAAYQGDSKGQAYLASCYLRGEGVVKDEKESVQWFRKAADQKNGAAQYYLGYCYNNGVGLSKDETQAAYWFNQSAEEGNPSGQNALGGCYYAGMGLSKDQNKAAEWFQRSAVKGHPEGQYNIGLCYDKGIGVNIDKKEAVKWFLMSADQGYANAQHSLGVCYYNGYGVEKNVSEAMSWFSKSANQGNIRARNALANVKANADTDRILKQVETRSLPQSSTNPQHNR